MCATGEWRARVGGAAGFALALGLGEWGARALAGPAPLGPSADPLRGLLSVLGLLALVAGPAALGRRVGWAGAVALAAWWGPEVARGAGRAPAWGLAAVLLVGVVWRGRSVARLGLGLGLGVAAGMVGGGPAPVAAPSSGAPSSGVLVVTVDTARADAGLLDALPAAPPGAAWVHRGEAVAPAPWTLPSVVSLWTGMPVAAHGAGLATGGGGEAAPAPGLPWWPARIARAGWDTVALVQNPHITPQTVHGFGRFVSAEADREPLLLLQNLDGLRVRRWGGRPLRAAGRDARVLRAAAAAVAAPGDGRPRLIWAHLMGPHEALRGGESLPPEDRARRYGAAVRAAGRSLAPLLAAVPPGWWVVVTSDHGESLGEGGRWGHGSALDGAQLRVPLAVRAPVGAAWGPPAPLALASVLPFVLGGVPLEGGLGVPVAGLRGVPHPAHVWDGAVARPVGPPLVAGAPIAWPAGTADALEALGYANP